MSAVAAPDAPQTERATLALEGMTCASCAARIEKRLNRLDGVQASVNFASEQAAVTFDGSQVSLDQLIAAVEAAGYHASLSRPEAAAGDAAKPWLVRTLMAAALSAPLAALAWIPALQFSGWRWISLALATPAVAVAGWPFHLAAARSARHLTSTMDTLISVGTLAAWTWSVVVVATGAHEAVYFDAAALITTLILLGRYLEARAKHRSGEAMRALLELGAKQARLLIDGEEQLVAVERVEVGDLFVVRPGEKLPTDGLVVDGSSSVDQSMFTGEPVPKDVVPGDDVSGGTINTSGRLVVRATRVGAQTALAQISRLVLEAQAGKASVQRLADRVAAVFVPIILVVALLTLAGWLALGAGAASAFQAAVAVIVIACPCALGLATPTALMVGTGRGAQLGILIRSPEVLERTRRVTAVVLDKTGTVTEGRMSVDSVSPAAGVDERELLALAAGAEAGSEHPIARAIADHGRELLGGLPAAERFVSSAGLGVQAVVQSRAVLVGRPQMLAQRGVDLPHELAAETRRLELDGATVVLVAWDGAARGVIAISDRIKPTSAAAIADLRALGLRPILLTGDNEHSARLVAGRVGIETVIAGVLPEQKAAEIERLRRRGEVVAMVGDGVNDAPALATADLGLAIGTGADVAIEASDLTLVSGDLRAAADAIRLARSTLTTIKGNLFWAFAYNVAAVPLAAAGLLDPVIAAAAMSFSSLFVLGNSLRLRRFRSPREAT